jgi:hypothetical protein
VTAARDGLATPPSAQFALVALLRLKEWVPHPVAARSCSSPLVLHEPSGSGIAILTCGRRARCLWHRRRSALRRCYHCRWRSHRNATRARARTPPAPDPPEARRPRSRGPRSVPLINRPPVLFAPPASDRPYRSPHRRARHRRDRSWPWW